MKRTVSKVIFFLTLTVLLSGCKSQKNVFKPNDVFVVYNSDHEAPKDRDGILPFAYESIYALPIKKYSTVKPSKGLRLSKIGYKRNPVWNKQGTKVAFLSFAVADSFSFKNGQIIIKNVLNNTTTTLKNMNAGLSGLSWDESGNILAFGASDNRVSIYDLKLKEKKILFTAKSRPEGISISPNGKHIIYMTRDGLNENDADGWRPNLFNMGGQKIIKIGLVNDKFGVRSNFWWKYDSSQVLFKGFLLNDDNKRFYNYWTYNLITKELIPYSGDLKNFQTQSVRYWQAEELY